MFTQQRAPTRSASASRCWQRANPAARIASSRLSGLASQAPTSAIEDPGGHGRGRVGVDLVQRRRRRPAASTRCGSRARAAVSIQPSGESKVCGRGAPSRMIADASSHKLRRDGPLWRRGPRVSHAGPDGAGGHAAVRRQRAARQHAAGLHSRRSRSRTPLATVRRVFEGPINFLDTSQQLRRRRAPDRHRCSASAAALPDGFVLADQGRPRHGHRRLLRRPRARARWRSSLERLGLDRARRSCTCTTRRHITFEEGDGPGRPGRGAASRSSDEGVIAHLGVAGGPIDLMRRYIRTGAFDGRAHPQPLQRSSTARPSRCSGGAPARGRRAQRRAVRRRDPGRLQAGAGLLRLPRGEPRDPARIEHAARDAACERHGVPLAAAAIQFPMRGRASPQRSPAASRRRRSTA